MKRRNLVFTLAFLFFFLISSTCVSATVFSAGDRVPLRYPESGMGTAILEKPKFVRYTLFDPAENVVYEEDHQLTYRHEEYLGLKWEWYDEYSIAVPSFPAEGTWKISGRLFSELLWIIEDPSLFPYEKEFEVESSGLLENLLAPWYLTIDMGMAAGRFSLAFPVSWQLIMIVVVLIVVIMVLFVMILRTMATPIHRGNNK